MNNYRYYLLQNAKSFYLELIQQFNEDQSNIIINNFDLFL